ncbi:protein IMPAIRED IN BABA-INDUCED STERILITY 1-like [Abrus precatorius]|uniref:Protein IMPAIRED IN BABA-INDUCED STERILITY 1-like n=1 Tax=Abrus precatorius TaxID=3816 RepID=A0A8B8MK01_ABRPR|nr:protein IMPAIRED IN BABA-INDUCED STERILITY 1-like [Abrus precatorius]XP_027369072.1 protein IMPAIRED IN BABA-INDUCED STERILITY 1-like [Abrus precatorius]
MGCVVVKQAVSVTPAIDHSVELENNRKKKTESVGASRSELGESGRASSNGGSESLSFRLGNLSKYVEGEQAAAGWPAWLSAVACEAIHGWVPLRADAFEKLDKIGQGTYSSVFRAKEIETGKIVALKKVRFDNFEPESVRFMAREIMILRRLDHPNIIKLEGLITSRLSCSIYLVFEYMEHDITGLLSRPEIKFSEPQIKCYMKQLLSGLEHCHSRGVMHRDIKGSNLLVNNEGILKVADFGLANFCNSGNKQPLTSRVVTLWYRPPELLLGSTDYGASVDLWSVGCVFAELLVGKPILQGRTEVEQLHKIFKLCGSPPDEYWKKTRLPHATLFKPQQPYDSCLRETFKDFPASSVNLIQTLLSVEPNKRGTASSALSLEYFKTKPYACDPSSLPVYPPSKEIDAKHEEESRRKKIGGRVCGPETRKPSRKPLGLSKLAPAEDFTSQTQTSHKMDDRYVHILKEENTNTGEEAPKQSSGKPEDSSQMKNASQVDIPFPGPLQVSKSSGFAWAKRRRDDTSIRSHTRSISRGYIFNSLETSTINLRNNSESINYENKDFLGAHTNFRGHHDLPEISKLAMQNQWSKFDRPDSFDTSEEYHSQELSVALYHREDSLSKRSNLSYQDQGEKVEFSGPLLSQMHTVDELLEKHERHIRRTVRRSWFQRGKRQGK